MIYIKCFSRSRVANYLQPVFFVPGASMLSVVECCRRCPLCAVPGASMLSGVDCCSRCPLRRSWCLDAVRCGLLQPVPLCAVPGASTQSYYIHYGISQILGTLHRSTLLAAHYRLYRTSRRLGNCEQT